MSSDKNSLGINFPALLCVLILALALVFWRGCRQSEYEFTPIEGNPEIPAVSEEAEQMNRMFERLLEKTEKRR